MVFHTIKDRLFSLLQYISYHQVVPMNPNDWGWKIEGTTMTPIKSDKAVAPESLLKVIKCNCKLTTKAPCSTNLCSCRKHGLRCLSSCGKCYGETCENKEVNLSIELLRRSPSSIYI